jgi:pullulanase
LHGAVPIRVLLIGSIILLRVESRSKPNPACKGGTFIPLIVVSGGPLQSVLERFPHLKGATAFRISQDSCAQIPELLKGQLVLVKFNDDRPVDATSLQIPGVLDDLFYFGGELGAHPS